MRVSRRYFAAVILLVALAVAFGVFGTVAPPLAEESESAPDLESSSESVGHFQNPPTYDSGWVDIMDKRGQSFNITHSLNVTEVIVDITGRQSLSGIGGEHQRNYGVTGLHPGWTKTYGGASIGQLRSIVQTHDGGYIFAGWDGAPDFRVAKIDASGDILWSQSYGGGGVDCAWSVVATADGGYAIGGYTDSYGAGGSDVWLVKTDSSGNYQWSQSYGSAGDEFAYSLVQTRDGGYALAGSTTSYGSGGADAWWIKTDPAGNMEFDWCFGDAADDYAYSLVETTDGGYALAGYTSSYGAGLWDFWLIKIDQFWEFEWNRTYGGTGSDIGRSVVQTADGGYALAGYTDSFGATVDSWLIKTDAGGTALWNKTLGGIGSQYAWSVIQANDGGYVLAGYCLPPLMEDAWLAKTDSGGNMQWNKTYGAGMRQRFYSVIQANDGGYVSVGWNETSGGFLAKHGTEAGLAWTDSTDNTITLYRGKDDEYWNYVRVRMWLIMEPSWMYGDINMDGTVDATDLYILSRNYGKTLSLLSLGGVVAVAGIHTVKKRKQPKQPSYIS